jgi:hypothetical protein
MRPIFSGSVQPISSISIGANGTRVSIMPLKNDEFGFASVTLTVYGSTVRALVMLRTIEGRWRDDRGIFSFPA